MQHRKLRHSLSLFLTQPICLTLETVQFLVIFSFRTVQLKAPYFFWLLHRQNSLETLLVQEFIFILFYFYFFILLPPEFLPESGPTEWWCASTHIFYIKNKQWYHCRELQNSKCTWIFLWFVIQRGNTYQENQEN